MTHATTPASSAMTCTCPSGDGSLRHPCPAHPPEASQPVAAAPAHIKRWPDRLPPTATVDNVNDAMQAEINDLRAALEGNALMKAWSLYIIELEQKLAALQQRQAPAQADEDQYANGWNSCLVALGAQQQQRLAELQATRTECGECGLGYRHALDCPLTIAPVAALAQQAEAAPVASIAGFNVVIDPSMPVDSVKIVSQAAPVASAEPVGDEEQFGGQFEAKYRDVYGVEPHENIQRNFPHLDAAYRWWLLGRRSVGVAQAVPAPADELDHADTVLRVQEALGITTTGWVSPDVILLRIRQAKRDAAPAPADESGMCTYCGMPRLLHNRACKEDRVPDTNNLATYTFGDGFVYYRKNDADRHFSAPAPVAAVPVASDYVLMPKRLTAENGAKGALSGEFVESFPAGCHECDGVGEVDDGYKCETCDGEGQFEQRVLVEWDTIKRIYARAVALLAAPVASQPAQSDIARDAEFMDALDAYMDAVTVEERNSDNRIAARKRIFAAAEAWAGRASQPAGGGEAKCWSCHKPYTLEQRADADGNCPHCGVEIELPTPATQQETDK